MTLIKITIIVAIIYFAINYACTIYIKGLTPFDKIRLTNAERYTKNEKIFFVTFGFVKLLLIILIIITLISLVIIYL